MKTPNSLSQLEEDIFIALKSWHDVISTAGCLDYLRLYRQALLDGASTPRQAMNQVLLNALEILDNQDAELASVLRMHFLDKQLMYEIANRLNVSEPTGFRRQKRGVTQLTKIIDSSEKQCQANQKSWMHHRLEPPTYIKLIGAESHVSQLMDIITSFEPPHIIAIAGIGGIGKTSLADMLSRRIISEGEIDDFAWVSIRPQIFDPGGSIQDIADPAQTIQDLVEALLTQLLPNPISEIPRSPESAFAMLQTRLRQYSHLIVIDNLETMADLQNLLPILKNLADPSKFLLTSRKSIFHETGLYHFRLPGLDKTNTLNLIRHEATLNNIPDLAKATDADLTPIYQIVGGNPLAVRLVIGQTHIHALGTILDDLRSARGQRAELLYTFIYRQAWNNLDDLTRQVFLVMPLVADQSGEVAYLSQVTDIEPEKVRDALDHLVTLNLVDSHGGLNERYYTIHNLTRSFLHKQVAKW